MHIIFLLDSTGLGCPRKPRNSHPVNRTSPRVIVFESPLSKNKSPTTSPRGEFLVSCSFRLTSKSPVCPKCPSPKGHCSLSFETAKVSLSSRKPSLTMPCGWINCPCSGYILSVYVLTCVLPLEQQCWLSHFHIPASNAGPSMEKAASDCGI